MAPWPCNTNKVCVMDAASQLGSVLVKWLLRRGYIVHAASQNKDITLRFIELTDEESRRLKIFKSVDLFDYQTILEAVKGCSGLFYSFEPPHELDRRSYDEYMVDVEVRAAHNVLEACAQTETIDKVIFTSSVTAIVWNESELASPSSVLDENNWSDPNYCRKSKLWYALAKTSAEKTAWALAMDRNVTMVTINAGLLLTPDLAVTDPYVKGAAEMYGYGVFVTVDLEFLAKAHICTYEDVAAFGRYLCFNKSILQHEDAVKLSQTLDPSDPCPSQPSPPAHGDYGRREIIKQRIRNRKLEELMEDFDRGIEMQSLDQNI